jgi:hypothetical protein
MGRSHFVCHDCVEEGVYSDRAKALEARDAHVAETGHRVSLKDIAGSVA